MEEKLYLVQFTMLGEKGEVKHYIVEDEYTLIQHLDNTKEVIKKNITGDIQYSFIEITDEDIPLGNRTEVDLLH